MANTPYSIYGIDFRKDCICLACYLPDHQSIESIVVNPLAVEGGDWWAAAREEFLALSARLKLSRRDAVISLPAEHAIIKRFTFDKDEDDIAGAVQWELSQQILGDVGSYAFDFQQLARDVTDGYNDFLVAAYRQDVVQRCSEMLRTARLQPVIVDLDLFGLVNTFEFNYHASIAKPAIIALGDSDRIILTLTQNGGFIDFEVVTSDTGFQDVGACTKAMLAGIDVLHGANASVWGGVRPDVWLAGSLFTQADLISGIKSDMERIEVINPFAAITCRAEIAEEDIKRFSPQLAVAVGLAVRGGKDLHHD